jgi:hypothetical protein
VRGITVRDPTSTPIGVDSVPDDVPAPVEVPDSAAGGTLVSSSTENAHHAVALVLPHVIVALVCPESRDAVSRPAFGVDCPTSTRSVKLAGGVSVAGVAPFATAPMHALPVSATPANTVFGVPAAAPLSVGSDCRIALVPARDIPVTFSIEKMHVVAASDPLALKVKFRDAVDSQSVLRTKQ